ncbi:MAG: hypothetical protein LBK71_09390 [Verrucomicrobiales bacterium]|jgi:hypothetical protein|nr:hypothetical protein [Verrucomicrobiales bacterium]
MKKLAIIGVMLSLAAGVVGAQQRLEIINPNEIAVSVPTEADMEAWQFQFKTLDEFTNAIMRSEYQLLNSGENGQMYYLIFRYENQLVAVNIPKDGGEFRYGSMSVSDGVEVKPNPYSPLPILLRAKVGTLSQWRVREISGVAMTVQPDYKGTLTVELQRWNDGVGKEQRSRVKATVDWQ